MYHKGNGSLDLAEKTLQPTARFHVKLMSSNPMLPIQKVRKIAFRNRGRSAQSFDVGGALRSENGGAGDGRMFLQIKPAFTDPKTLQRSNSTLTGSNDQKDNLPDDAINIQALGEGKVQLHRSPQEKDRLPDRISLDRRGLSTIPQIVGEPGLRLLSLQHNLINSLTGLIPLDLGKLVFLDVYDNQIDKINSLDRLYCLRVLLMGKNRIKRIEGLSNLSKLEVLDLHGNRISKVSGLSSLIDLKVLNLAGNQIRTVGSNDLQGLISLRELNFKRNRMRKLHGFQYTPKLQKLYLGNNDLQSVEDVSSLSEATSLTEVSLDNNPVALGGDCTPFLVSYLPNLVTLTNMNVTDQVRQAAMAWRTNKEAAHAAYCALGSIAQESVRRDQIIHNARTNWELLRSENNKLFTSPCIKDLDVDLKQSETLQSEAPIGNNGLPDVIISLQVENTEDSDSKNNNSDALTSYSEPITKPAQIKKLQRSATAKKCSERRVYFSERSASQDTDASHSTSTSSDLRLPPLLLPIITSLENVKLSEGSEPVLKRWESISSVEPVADESFSSLPSTSSESEEEINKKPVRRTPTMLRRRNFGTMRSKSVCDSESRRSRSIGRNVDNSDNASNISTGTNIGSVATSSTSSSDQNSKSLRVDGSINSRISNRSIKSATVSRRNERALSANRASTARAKSGKSLANLKSSEPIPKPVPSSKDREQGVDYLVEISDGTVSVWGAGAVRRLSRDWDWEKARTVTRASFHYVYFNAIAQALPELKHKFPNVSKILVRATGLQWLGQLHALAELRGLTSLTVLPEGNPIHNKVWREYAIYRLAHWGLKEINDSALSDEEIKFANLTYSGLSDIVLRAIPDAPLQPLLSRLGRSGTTTTTAKAWLQNADPALRDVIAKEALQLKSKGNAQEDANWRSRGRIHLVNAIEVACGAAQRLKMLEILWPTILVEMIEDALRDFSDLEGHVKEQMLKLMDPTTP